MNELVLLKGNDVFTDSMLIAQGTKNEHESVVTLIKKYKSDFGEFSQIEFTDLKSRKRGRPTRVDGEKIKADTFYRLVNDEFVEN